MLCKETDGRAFRTESVFVSVSGYLSLNISQEEIHVVRHEDSTLRRM
jgi:hypothetical protein